MKLFICLLLASAVAAPVSAFASEAPDPGHRIEFVEAADISKGALDFRITYSNGETRTYDGSHRPIILNGSVLSAGTKTVGSRTYVPLRAIGEGLGFSVSWDPAGQKAALEKDGHMVEICVGAAQANVDGETRLMDAEALAIEGLAFIPLSFASGAFSAEVSYIVSQDAMIVSGVNGNIVIEAGGPENAEHSEEEAENAAKAEIRALFENFKRERAAGKGAVVERLCAKVGQMIESMEVIGEASRYYILSGPKIVLFDKRSGAMRFRRSTASGSVVEKVSYDFGRFEMFKDYFTDYI